LIELLIVIVLIWIISVVAFINFWNQTPNARNAMRLDASSKIQTAFQISNLEETIPSTSCLSWSSEYTLSWTISWTWCHISLNWSQEFKNFLNNFKITWTFQDPLNETKWFDDFLYEFNYKLWSSQQEFVYLTEPTSNKSSFIQTNSLNYQSWSLNELHIDWNFPNIEKSISPIILKDKNWAVFSDIQWFIKFKTQNWKNILTSFENSQNFKNKILSFSNIHYNKNHKTNPNNSNSGQEQEKPWTPSIPNHPFWFVNEEWQIWNWKTFKTPSPEHCFDFNLIDDSYYEIWQKKIDKTIPFVPICDLEELVIPSTYKGLPVKEIKENWFSIRQTVLICSDKRWNQFPDLALGWPPSCNKSAERWSYSTAPKNYCLRNWNEYLTSSSSCIRNWWIYFKFWDGVCSNNLWMKMRMTETECQEKKQFELLKERTFSMQSYNFSNRVKSIIIPNTVNKIKYSSFSSDNNEEDKKTNYKLDEFIIPSSVEIINNFAFAGIHANKIKFWENSKLQDLWIQTFYQSNIEFIEIPENLSKFSNWVFLGNLQKMITFLRNGQTETWADSFWQTNLSNQTSNLFWTWILNNDSYIKP